MIRSAPTATMFVTYPHGLIGAHVSRCVPDPKRICAHSWSSVKLALFDNRPLHSQLEADLSGEMRYNRLLVLALRHALGRKARVVGWNGISRRIFLRVYQGRGSKRDHARFLFVERVAHRLAKLSIAELSNMIEAKQARARLP